MSDILTMEFNRLLFASGENLANLYIDWRARDVKTSSLIAHVQEEFGIPSRTPFLTHLFTVAAAADAPVALPFHNQHHTREVTAAMIMLLKQHRLFMQPQLDAQDICTCLIAAMAHDLGHLGRPNKHPHENEDTALRMLARTVSIDKNDFDDIRRIIHATVIKTYPVAPPRQPAPSEKLQVMIDLLRDADLAPSLATTHAFNRQMSAALALEDPNVTPTDENLRAFAAYALPNGFHSDAGRKCLSHAHGKMLQAITPAA